MSLAAQYARRARLAASPDFAEQTKLAALRAEHRKQLTDAEAKFAAEVSTLRQELVAARRELNCFESNQRMVRPKDQDLRRHSSIDRSRSAYGAGAMTRES